MPHIKPQDMSFHYSLCVFAPPMLATLLLQNLLWNQKITESISEALHILHSWNLKPMHKPTAQPGVGPLPLMSGHVSHLWPTFPMLVYNGSHRCKWLCLENSIQEQISQHLSNHMQNNTWKGGWRYWDLLRRISSVSQTFKDVEGSPMCPRVVVFQKTISGKSTIRCAACDCSKET